MEVFRDLHISATAEQMASVADEMERALPEGWTRDRAMEARAQAAPLVHKPVFCFACQAEGQRAGALVVLMQKDAANFHLSNIIPRSRSQLTQREYNAILEEFHDRLLRPALERAGLTADLSGAAVGLDHWMSAATAEKLQHFSANANKGTGTSADRERWNDFVLSAHQEQSRLDGATLKRWLSEVEDWPPEVAEQLALEYESGRALLAYAEGHRRSA